MNKIYLVELNMYDGEEYTTFVDCFKNYESAKKHFDEVCEDYKVFWENFDTIEKDDNFLTAYDEGWYDDAHIEIDIDEQEIMGE